MIHVAGNISLKISLGIFIILALLVPKSLEERTVINASVYTSLPIDSTLLQNGDLIFRRGISFVSNLVLEHDSETPYSHVGLIFFEEDHPFVIHAVPDESETEIDYIKKDPLNIFLRSDRASAYAITRYNNEKVASAASRFAKNLYMSKIIFDDAFSLKDTSKLYCTEMVWQAFKHAGVNLTDNKFDTLSIPIGENPYLLPGTIFHSPHTIEITKTSIFQ